jgi:hypothetical protein
MAALGAWFVWTGCGSSNICVIQHHDTEKRAHVQQTSDCLSRGPISKGRNGRSVEYDYLQTLIVQTMFPLCTVVGRLIETFRASPLASVF